MVFFAWYSSTIVHALLFNHSQILEGIKNTVKPKRYKLQATDIHYTLISKYPEVPQWWYGIVFFISLGMALVGLIVYVPEAPKWVPNISLKILTSVALFCNRINNCFHSPCWDPDGNHKQWTGPKLYRRYCWRLCNIWSSFGSEHVHRLWINDTQSSYLFHIGSQAWSLCQDSPTGDVQSTDLGHIVVRGHGNSNSCTCHD